MLRTTAAIIIMVFCHLPCALAEAHLTLGGIEKSVNHRIGAAILEEAYGKIGYRVSFMALPTKRSLHLADKGALDGEVQRVDGLEKEYTNLVKVPEPLFMHIGSVYTKTVQVEIKDWESLTPYSVGIRRGVKFAEKATAKHPDRLMVGSFEQLIHIIQKGRVDLIVGSRYYFDDYIRKKNITDVKRIDPPIHVKPLFHYLHRKNIELVPALTRTLQEMTASGESDQIRIKTLSRLSVDD